MTLPNLPTDNLYKFIFLAGLTIIFSSIILYVTQSYQIEGKLDLLEIEAASADMEVTFLDEDADLLMGKVENIERKHLMINKGELDSIQKNNNELRTISRRVKLNRSLNNVKLQILKREIKKLTFMSIWTPIAAFIGALIALWSGFKWYYLVQKPMDQKIQFELKELQSNKATEIHE